MDGVAIVMRRAAARQWRAAAGGVLLASVACGGRAPAGERPTRLRVAYTSNVDVGDLPSLVAQRRLETSGYHVEPIFFAQPELAVEALARGDVEFANGGTRAFWAAVAKGADLLMLMEHADNGYQIATVPQIRRCEDLAGRTLALSTPGALPTALGEAYLQRCPAAKPQVLAMPRSGDRLAALAAGAVDAAMLQRADVIRLDQRAPGRFRVLAVLDDEFPGLRFEGVFVNGAFARAHRSVVVDYAHARINANREAVTNPALLFDEARRWPAMATLDEAIVDAEVRAPAWAPDGGLHPGSVAATLDLFVRAGSLPGSLFASPLADPSFLTEALRAAGPPASDSTSAPRRRP